MNSPTLGIWARAMMAAVLLPLTFAACGDDDEPVGPVLGNLEVSAVTTGADLDSDGYQVAVDGGTPRSLSVNGTVTFSGLTSGARSVELTGIAANCTVAGDNPRSVTVGSGTVSTTFEVACAALAGDLEVTTTTTGDDPDDGYTVSVDGGTAQAIGANATITLADLPAGTRSVLLGDVAANCTVTGANPMNVDVPVGGSATAAFAVECSSTTGQLDVTAATTGNDLDPDGYTVSVDGGAAQAIAIDGTVSFPGLTEGDHTVALGDAAANCSVAGDNPRTVTVTAGQTAATTFDVSCTQIVGSIEVTVGTTGIGLDADGYQVALDGEVVATIAVNETTTIAGVAVGDRSVEIQGIAATCSVQTTNPETVTVTDGVTSSVAFDLFCFRPLSDELVFVSDREGNADLIFSETNGSGQVNLTNNPAADRNPTIAPDGAAVVFESDRGTGIPGIWHMDATGFTKFTTDAARERDPSYAGDFRGIAFQRKTSTTTWQIWRVNVNGTTAQALTGELGNDVEPAWSNDGTLILFQSDRDGGDRELYVMDADGSNQTRLTNSVGVDGRPAWSPDGTLIAFVSDRDGNFDVFVADFDAGTKSISNITNVTNHAASDFMPAWNGDGTRIAFASDRSGDFEVWTMNPDGTGLDTVSNVAGAKDDEPAWSN